MTAARVDVLTEIQAVVRSLRADGLGARQIARAAGISRTMARRLVDDDETRCTDCGWITLSSFDGHLNEFYMVHDLIWAEAGMGRGLLCIGCLEARLGRRLHRADFTDAPLNDPDAPGRYAYAHRTARLRACLADPGQLSLWPPDPPPMIGEPS